MRSAVIFLLLNFVIFPVNAFCEDEKTEFRNEIFLKARNIFQSDVDAHNGSISIYETETEFNHAVRIAQVLPFNFSIAAGHIGIDSNFALELPNHLESRHIGLGVKLPAPILDHEHFFAGFDIYPTLNTDDGTWKSGAFRIPFRAMLIYKKSDEFIVVAGVKVRPEYDTTVLPVIGFIYIPNERLSFNIASTEPNISYKLSEKTKLIWEFDITNEEYEVTRGTQEGVVLRYKEASTGIGIEHKIVRNVKVHVSVGGVFNRRLEYDDDQGKVVPDSGIYAAAKINFIF